MGWWRGESRGQRGLFPDNFVMPLAAVEPGVRWTALAFLRGRLGAEGSPARAFLGMEKGEGGRTAKEGQSNRRTVELEGGP